MLRTIGSPVIVVKHCERYVRASWVGNALLIEDELLNIPFFSMSSSSYTKKE